MCTQGETPPVLSSAVLLLKNVLFESMSVISMYVVSVDKNNYCANYLDTEKSQQDYIQWTSTPTSSSSTISMSTSAYVSASSSGSVSSSSSGPRSPPIE